jgi:ABC-type sugar transport system substrate-binding protein
MMKKRKLGIAAAAAATLLGVTACGSDDSSGSSDASSAPTEESSGDCAETYQVGWANLDAGILYYRDLEAGLQEFADANCWEFTATDAAYDIPKQIAQIEDMIVKGVDLIIAAPGDRDALVAVYEKANEAGIPMLSTGNNLADGNEALEIGFVGTDWEVEGVRQTEWMVSKLAEGDKVARIGGVGATQYVQKRKAGFEKVMGENPGIEVVFNQDANGFNQEEGLRLAQDALTANPDLKAIWADSDALALGAVQALNERGLSQADVLVLGSDGEPIAFDQIRSGEGVDYTIALHGLQWGRLTAEVAHAYLTSGSTGYEYFIQAPTEGVSADNIADRTNEDLR